jgi:3-methyladenine DNA glycosylase/8-oxoguanine DNA glycosylase
MAIRIRLTTSRLNFLNLIHSHGWWMLAPFRWDEHGLVLSRPIRLQSGRSVPVQIRGRADAGASVSITASARNSAAVRGDVRAAVKRMLSLDQDLTDFHARCAEDELLRFAHETGSGRMLRAPTAFEDVIKTICTTNCNWQNTRKMCAQLCALDPDGNFPSPQRLGEFTQRKLERAASVGYRSRTILKAAHLTASGQLPLDAWAAAGEFGRIRQALSSIWGIGPYALNHILVLLGDFTIIPVDSEILRYLRTTHFGGEKVPASEAVKPYEQFGEHRYLAFKFGRMARKMLKTG